MNMREALLAVYAYVEAEIEKAKKPYADKFDLTSLSFCVSKALPNHPKEAEEALAEIRKLTAAQHWPRSDVMAPWEILSIVGQTLSRN